ncbi:hypothetical protein ACUV84_027216 [Puccinellia chinampoensis]
MALHALYVKGQLSQPLWLLDSAREPLGCLRGALSPLRVVSRGGGRDAGIRACRRGDTANPSFSLRLLNAMLNMLVEFGKSWHA